MIKAGTLIFLAGSAVPVFITAFRGDGSVRIEDTPAKTCGGALEASSLSHNWRIVGLTHFGISDRVCERCTVFLPGVVGLRGVLLIGVLGFAGELVGVDAELFALGGRSLRLVPVGNAASRNLYSFWYTRGGHGGRGWILGRANVCFNLCYFVRALLN